MRVYHFDNETKVFLGYSDLNQSDICPITGAYLIPAFATNIQPPEVLEGKQTIFNHNAWEVVDIPKPVEPKLEEPLPVYQPQMKEPESLTEDEMFNNVIKSQIFQLESKQTLRRMREMGMEIEEQVLQEDGSNIGWMRDLDNKINVLRRQLKG